MGTDQPKVAAQFNGRLANFSSARLMRMLTTLRQDFEIVVRATWHRRQREGVLVGETHA
ncbi:MAG: XRE family transcriptional regulator [Vicinamibacterales bacterium]